MKTREHPRVVSARSKVRYTMNSAKGRRWQLTHQQEYRGEVTVTVGRPHVERAALTGRRYRPDRPNLSHRIRECWIGWHHDLDQPMLLAVFYCNVRSYDLGRPDPGAELCRRCEFAYSEKERRDA